MNRSFALPALVLAAAAAVLLSACTTPQKREEPPAPVAPTPPPLNEKLSADGLFAFGKSSLEDLSDEGRAALDDLAAKLNAVGRLEAVRVIGHSDRIGSDDYNLKLSTQRADAVKEYLTQKGVTADTITAVGRGKVEPIAECPDEQGQALIECLAPNRRVEVLITIARP